MVVGFYEYHERRWSYRRHSMLFFVEEMVLEGYQCRGGQECDQCHLLRCNVRYHLSDQKEMGT